MKPSTPKYEQKATYSNFPTMAGTPQYNESKKILFPGNLKKAKETQKMKPLQREFFVDLIKLESDFHAKKLTVETIDELTQMYAVKTQSTLVII